MTSTSRDRPLRPGPSSRSEADTAHAPKQGHGLVAIGDATASAKDNDGHHDAAARGMNVCKRYGGSGAPLPSATSWALPTVSTMSGVPSSTRDGIAAPGWCRPVGPARQLRTQHGDLLVQLSFRGWCPT
jgi:hypothetical protein